MALLINKSDFLGIQTSVGQMWQIAQLAFQATVPSMVAGVWGTSYNSTTKLVEVRNTVVDNSNYHNQTTSGINTMMVAIGSTELYTNYPIDLYAGETVTSSNNTLCTNTIAYTGLNTTTFYLTTAATVGVAVDPFIINNPYQTTYLDASVTLESALRTTEKSLAAIPTSSLSNVSSALNTFYVTNTGFSLKSYFDPLRTTTGLGMSNPDWNSYFSSMWSSTRNEDLVLRSSMFVGNGSTFISTDPLLYGGGSNVSYTVANALRLKIMSTAPTVLYNYTLAYTNGTTLSRTLTTPTVIAPGNTVTALESGTAQFIALVSIGASNAQTGALMEVYNT